MKKVFKASLDMWGKYRLNIQFRESFCVDGLHDLFSFPDETETIYFVVSDKSMPESYRVSQGTRIAVHLKNGEVSTFALCFSTDSLLKKLFGDNDFYVKVEY